jgi:tRNA G18 (ribose-2'-O)-methylase SpoU
MIKIDGFEDNRITLYKSLRNIQSQHLSKRVFIAESEKITLRVLKSNLEIHSILALESFYENNKELILSKGISEDNLFTANIEIMNKNVGFNLHSGIMAIAYQPEDNQLSTLDDQIVIMNSIIDSENVGSIVRNAAAFDINSIIVDFKSSSPFIRRAVRVGMGNIVNMKFYQSHYLVQDILKLKELGYRIISAEINDHSKSIIDYKFPEKFALIFGSEGKGIDKVILEISDEIIHIPMNKKVDSLNVASSSAIFMHHIKN